MSRSSCALSHLISPCSSVASSLSWGSFLFLGWVLPSSCLPLIFRIFLTAKSLSLAGQQGLEDGLAVSVPGRNPKVGKKKCLHLGGLELQEDQVSEHMPGAVKSGMFHLDLELHEAIHRDNVGDNGFQFLQQLSRQPMLGHPT